VEDKPNQEMPPRITRRKFVGTLGAAGAAAAFLQRGASQNTPSQTYYYQDSFGNIVPAGQGAISLGIYPPPIPASLAPPGAANVDNCSNSASGTYYSCGYPNCNILLIIVDQMRNPAFWLPSGETNWMNAYASIMPNITGLAKNSVIFPHYYVAATVCTPSRACLLTGLYSQQTSIFHTGGYGDPLVPPPLLPYNYSWSGNNNNAGFPTIGNVLSQALPVGNSSQTIQYDCTWIGKWHLSCATGNDQYNLPGENGPRDYGFGSSGNLNLPTTADTNSPYPASLIPAGYPSPNGDPNGGTGGDFLDSFTQSSSPGHDVPNWPQTLRFPNNNNVVNPPAISAINDAAIAYAFTNYWLPNANNTNNNATQPPFPGQITKPWFCAVSLVNPHDISDFPYCFALTNNNSYFGPPGNGTISFGFQPPPANNSSNSTWYGNDCYNANNNSGCASEGDVAVIAGFPSLYSAGLPPGTGNNGYWNYEDLSMLTYNNGYGGKPGLQAYFQSYCNDEGGSILLSPGSYNSGNNSWPTPTAWEIFLNYYAWLESCVDQQIGNVLSALSQSIFWQNTVIIFTSDHGDYGGSHGLHAKGGALYDEVLNVPLIISYPQLRASNTQVPAYSQYVCSAVDLLPYLYTLALGNHSWRSNANDMVYYLIGREEINDAINLLGNNSIIQERRISGIPLNSPMNSTANNWQSYQPFVLHTTDEFSTAGSAPSHAVAFRTVDLTNPNNDNAAPFAGQTAYGGGKLGIYSYWETCGAGSPPTMGLNNNQQYEFYNYSPNITGMDANPQEVGNQFFNNNGGYTSQGQNYYNDFFGISSPGGKNIQLELYYLQKYGSNSSNIRQVEGAIQTAFNNYISFLACEGWLTGSNGGTDTSCSTGCSNHSNPYKGLL
jgi:arylsulfatase A-like enzyme